MTTLLLLLLLQEELLQRRRARLHHGARPDGLRRRTACEFGSTLANKVIKDGVRTLRLSSSTVDPDSSIGDSWLFQELPLGPLWCQLVSEAAEAAVGR